MDARSHFERLALYNRWANRRLYAAAAELPDADYRADRGAFFKSVHGTLNHILVADRVWLRRLTGEGPQPPSLDAILHDDLPGLTAAREAEDARILAHVQGLDDARLAGTLVYRTMAGDPFEQPLALVLTHIFNHQTHHRGQAHTLLTQMGRAAPPLDLLYHLREAGA